MQYRWCSKLVLFEPLRGRIPAFPSLRTTWSASINLTKSFHERGGRGSGSACRRQIWGWNSCSRVHPGGKWLLKTIRHDIAVCSPTAAGAELRQFPCRKLWDCSLSMLLSSVFLVNSQMRARSFPYIDIAHKENVSKLQLREKNSAVLAALIWSIRDWIYAQ